MRSGALSAAALSLAGVRPIAEKENAVPRASALPSVGWSEQIFAEEQVQGLVRQVFSSALSPPVQQVVFMPVDSETDTRSLCLWVGRVLARENLGEVAVLDERESCGEASSGENVDLQSRCRAASVRQLGREVHRNLWTFPVRQAAFDSLDRVSLSAYLAEVRSEFEYSIVAGPAPTISSKALEMATFADGVILVLSAQRTRRIAALKVRNALAHVRLLGTVFSDREFPMPTSIYRRL